MKQIRVSASNKAVVPLDDQPPLQHASFVNGQRITFLSAFGVFGIPMVFVALVAIVWTMWLILLTMAPNATANYLMNTGQFDKGQFWLIIDPEPVLMSFSVCGLSVVMIGYLLVLSRMTLRRQAYANRLLQKSESQNPQRWARSSLKGFKIPSVWADLTGFHGRYRKLWVRVAARL